MTISLLLLCIIPVFLIPTILLPFNRLRFYLLSLTPPFFIVLAMYSLNAFIPSLQLEGEIGETFYPLWSFVISGYTELNTAERYHISCYLTYLLFFLILYFLSYLICKFTFLGRNPMIHKRIKTLHRVFDSLAFFILTYSIAFAFISGIKSVIPLNDGFLNPVMSYFFGVN